MLIVTGTPGGTFARAESRRLGCGRPWPTFDSDKHAKTLVNKEASGLVVAPNGQVTPEFEEVLKIIARENLVLATGHVHAEEVLAVTKKAKELGVKNILVTRRWSSRLFRNQCRMRDGPIMDHPVFLELPERT
jgi:hypothetical protein